MEQATSSKREGFHLRLPDDLKDWYRMLAARNDGSMNNEIVRVLIAHKNKAEQQEQRRAKRV